jgi:hypothetical protein
MQVKDLQAAIDDLRSEQQAIEATAKENHELVLEDARPWRSELISKGTGPERKTD